MLPEILLLAAFNSAKTVVIIGYFANYYSAGIYRIAKKLVDPINSIIVAFSPWILNKINNENTKIDIAKNNLGIKIARANFLKKVFI